MGPNVSGQQALGQRHLPRSVVCSTYSPGGSPWLSWPTVHQVGLGTTMDRGLSEPGLQGIPGQALPSAVRRYSPGAPVQRVGPCLQSPSHWPASRERPRPACPPSTPPRVLSKSLLPGPACLAQTVLPDAPPLPWQQTKSLQGEQGGVGWDGP